MIGVGQEEYTGICMVLLAVLMLAAVVREAAGL